jgi:3-oxoadipate enol-lactonase
MSEPAAAHSAMAAIGESRTVDTPRGRMAFGRRGEGPAVVLLHPLALAGEVWDEFGERLSAHFTVISPDARGHGRSSWDGAPFSATDLADDLGALLDALGVDTAHLVGMSMGGGIAMTFAGLHPERVGRIVLADTTAWYGPDAVDVWKERARRAVLTPRVRQVPFQADRWFTETLRAKQPAQLQRVVRTFLATDSRVHAEASRFMGGFDARELLPAVTAPTLALTGAEDYATPPEMGRYLADHVQDGKAVILQALRHLSLIERPDLAYAVREHLQGKTDAAIAALATTPTVCPCGGAASPATEEVA